MGKNCIEKCEINLKSNIIICSATQKGAIEREWTEHKIDKYVKVIAGQEMGSKAEHLQLSVMVNMTKIKFLWCAMQLAI